MVPHSEALCSDQMRDQNVGVDFGCNLGSPILKVELTLVRVLLDIFITFLTQT